MALECIDPWACLPVPSQYSHVVVATAVVLSQEPELPG
jgi:hypothetical protein